MPGNHPDIAGVLFSFFILFFMSQLYGKAELRDRIKTWLGTCSVRAPISSFQTCFQEDTTFFNRILNI